MTQMLAQQSKVNENDTMPSTNVSLNPAQLEVLSWIGEGCPDGVYSDWSHRISARTLHNRGLVVIKGRGTVWSAALTQDGTYYLAHGKYPPIDNQSLDVAGELAEEPTIMNQAVHAPTPRNSVASTINKTPKPKKPGPVDQMMTALLEAENHQIFVPSVTESKYRQLVGAAKRFGRIPNGMQLTVSWAKAGQYAVTLEPLPAWQTAVLEPITVSKELREPSNVVLALSDSSTFQVTGIPRKRSLLLADALVTTAREQGMMVEVRLNQPVRRDYYGRDNPRRDEIEFRLDCDAFRVWFTQATLQKPHEPTQSEIKRVQRGFLFPDFDYVPAEHLGLVLDGEGGQFWASEWYDTDTHQLDDDLAQILEEIRLRHNSLVEKRQAKQNQDEAKERKNQEDRAQALVMYRKHFLIEAMKKQAHRWEEATRLRNYATAVRTEAEELEGHAREQAQSWAAQLEAQAAKTDPLPSAATPPDIPEPSWSDLQPFLKSQASSGW